MAGYGKDYGDRRLRTKDEYESKAEDELKPDITQPFAIMDEAQETLDETEKLLGILREKIDPFCYTGVMTITAGEITTDKITMSGEDVKGDSLLVVRLKRLKTALREVNGKINQITQEVQL